HRHTLRANFASLPQFLIDAADAARSYLLMLTADPIAAFNTRLAHAKIHALQLLLDLMASMTDPDAVVGDAIRELRLAATAILRTQPMKEPRRASPPQPPDPPHAE